mmetsp:Transcript_37156/g.48956  ORF Transcript_37156/g.48956 Transcript_37156/m.48956 type:complete len:240 (-) Transcript_37156:4430-5149(-)
MLNTFRELFHILNLVFNALRETFHIVVNFINHVLNFCLVFFLFISHVLQHYGLPLREIGDVLFFHFPFQLLLNSSKGCNRLLLQVHSIVYIVPHIVLFGSVLVECNALSLKHFSLLVANEAHILDLVFNLVLLSTLFRESVNDYTRDDRHHNKNDQHVVHKTKYIHICGDIVNSESRGTSKAKVDMLEAGFPKRHYPSSPIPKLINIPPIVTKGNHCKTVNYHNAEAKSGQNLKTIFCN